ncbi:putative dehydrogenase [Mycena belliarum]|uniref:Dehydrogenase n=1 Tax=Mycena belliarum TaxID=1033014 RepID=A0AAD6U8H8_9AGAR|nr:putative dehydrogenase [Mycena belliae]
MQKAVRFASTGPLAAVLKVSSVANPTPASGYAIISIGASAINVSDVMNVEGRFAHTTTPRIPGRDFAGIAITGPDAGKRVWGTGGSHGFNVDGSHAQYISVPEGALSFMGMPANLSFAQAAAVGVPFVTAWIMVEKAGLKQGDYVLVLGSSGGVGAAVVQIARLKGAIPLETSRRSSQDAINTTQNMTAQVREKTGGQPLSAVIDSVGDAMLFKKALELLGPFGRYVFVSVGQTPGAQFSFDALDFYRESKTLIGVNSASYTFEDCVRILSELRAGFEQGVLQPFPNLELVDLGDEKAVLEAYNRVKAGAKMKQILVVNVA